MCNRDARDCKARHSALKSTLAGNRAASGAVAPSLWVQEEGLELSFEPLDACAVMFVLVGFVIIVVRTAHKDHTTDAS